MDWRFKLRWIKALVILSLSSQICWAGSTNYDFPRMRQFLLELKATHVLPIRHFEPSSIALGAEPLDQTTQALFAEMETQIFGSPDLIQLKSCSDCEVFSDYATHTIFVDPSMVAEVKATYDQIQSPIVIQFILAHEFGHFVQEASIGRGASPVLSLNGRVSLMSLKVAGPDDEMSGRLAHAEVDAYAFLILKTRLRVPPTVVLAYYENEIGLTQAFPDQNAQLMIGDLESRLQQARELLKKLW